MDVIADIISSTCLKQKCDDGQIKELICGLISRPVFCMSVNFGFFVVFCLNGGRHLLHFYVYHIYSMDVFFL